MSEFTPEEQKAKDEAEAKLWSVVRATLLNMTHFAADARDDQTPLITYELIRSAVKDMESFGGPLADFLAKLNHRRNARNEVGEE